MCDGHLPTLSELPSCYNGDDWSGCSLEEFMACPYNLANNRQTRMLADLSLVGCYNLSIMSESQRWAMLLESAKRNLRNMAFFGLTEYQRKTQYLFEHTFRLSFIAPFTQLNGTRAASVEVEPVTQRRIRELNQWDVELYEYARDLFPPALPVCQTAGAQGGPAATPAGEAQVTCQGEALVGGDWKSCF